MKNSNLNKYFIYKLFINKTPLYRIIISFCHISLWNFNVKNIFCGFSMINKILTLLHNCYRYWSHCIKLYGIKKIYKKLKTLNLFVFQECLKKKKEFSYKLLFFNTHTNTENEIQKDFNIYINIKTEVTQWKILKRKIIM